MHTCGRAFEFASVGGGIKLKANTNPLILVAGDYGESVAEAAELSGRFEGDNFFW
jgi:hypothetical protein